MSLFPQEKQEALASQPQHRGMCSAAEENAMVAQVFAARKDRGAHAVRGISRMCSSIYHPQGQQMFTFQVRVCAADVLS